MLKHRLLVGIPMAAAAIALLAFDRPPTFPGLYLLAAAAGILSVRELRFFVPAEVRPRAVVTTLGVLALLTANWYQCKRRWHRPAVDYALSDLTLSPWPAMLFVLVAAVLAAATYEVLTYTGSGTASGRLAGTVFALVYLGVLPGFLLQLRWQEDGAWAVLTTIFVPKVCDIGAYFTGRAIGRHKMTPTLSPKKTWEGLAGGLVASAVTAVGIGVAAPLFPHGPLEAAAFGLVIGSVGVVGDLFESLLKRDAQVKDASAALPGFGGVLDVIDSILFAAPVAYLWFALH